MELAPTFQVDTSQHGIQEFPSPSPRSLRVLLPCRRTYANWWQLWG